MLSFLYQKVIVTKTVCSKQTHGVVDNMITADPRNTLAMAMQQRLLEAWPEAAESDLTFVIGGDGWMLSTVAQYGYDRPYFGLNAGRVGFLLNEVEDWKDLGESLRNNSLDIYTFPLLNAHAETMGGDIVTGLALNDVYLERMTGQTARLQVSFKESVVVETLVTDGIIFSTSIGSTGYSLSAGGPSAHPTLPAIFVTPICAHKPRLPSFALPQDAECRVVVQMPEHRSVRCVVDGREIKNVVSVKIEMSETSAKLAFLPGHSFTAAMVRKVLQG